RSHAPPREVGPAHAGVHGARPQDPAPGAHHDGRPGRDHRADGVQAGRLIPHAPAIDSRAHAPEEVAMRPSLALSIGAVLAAIFGAALTFLPEQMLGGFGLAAPKEALVVSRDVGVTLLGLAIINWLGRNATGDVLRALLWGNIFIQVA